MESTEEEVGQKEWVPYLAPYPQLASFFLFFSFSSFFSLYGEWCFEPTFSAPSHGKHCRFAIFQAALPTRSLILSISKENLFSLKWHLNLK